MKLFDSFPEPGSLSQGLQQRSSEARQHRFNFLGTGVFSADYGTVCSGLEGHCYNRPGPDPLPWKARFSALRWRNQLESGYRPIDWQRDYHSGYRWSESVASRRLKFGLVAGADIRVAWELARCHQLLPLAFCGEAREVEQQIADFMAHNPVGYGVQWFCAMEAALRVSNFIVAWEILRLRGQPPPRWAARVVELHLEFIWNHLEWHPQLRTNHYLSNLCGLAIGLAYVSERGQRQEQLEAVLRLLDASIQEQFGASGANLEASTHYHRLSAEMVAWALASLERRGLRVSSSSLSRLRGAGHFSQRLTRPDGRVVALGDGDDGRFLPIVPAEVDDHRGLGGLLGQLFQDEALLSWSGPAVFEGTLARDMQADASWEVSLPLLPKVRLQELSEPPKHASRWRLDSLPPPEHCWGYTDFGVFVWRGPEFFLALRCGELGQMGRGGHAHCDQLSMELYYRQPLLTDPGTYVYTSLPEARNRYRCTSAHNGPRLPGWEQGDLTVNLFRLERAVQAEPIHFSALGFEGRMACKGGWLHRQLRWLEGGLEVADWWSLGPGVHGIAEIMAGHNPGDAQPLPLSPGYGRLNPSTTLLSGRAINANQIDSLHSDC